MSGAYIQQKIMNTLFRLPQFIKDNRGEKSARKRSSVRDSPKPESRLSSGDINLQCPASDLKGGSQQSGLVQKYDTLLSGDF